MRGLLIASILIAFSYAEEKTIVKQNGDSLSLNCQASSAIEWKKNGAATLEGVKSASANGETNSTLTKENVTVADAGNYVCYNKDAGSVINNHTVTIISLSGDSADLVVNSTSMELTCKVDNSNIAVTSIAWTRNDAVLNNTEKYTITPSNSSHESTITVAKPVAKDAGVYNCVVTVDNMDRTFSRILSLDTKPVVRAFEKLRSKVEGETAMIVCNVTGYPMPEITWWRQLEDTTDKVKVTYDERVNTTDNSDGVKHSILMISKLKIKTDRGDYTCTASNHLGSDEKVVTLKVKDKLAAVWPFLGICAEVAILCSIIFIFEKRRNRRMEEEEEVDAVKANLMEQSNGNEEVRQRTNATKA